MSDSELSDTVPSDREIERVLRKTVNKLRDSPDATINVIRRAAEKTLSLKEGFLNDGIWKPKSKSIIQNQFEKDAGADDGDDGDEDEGKIEVKAKSKAKAAPKKPAKVAGTKRKAAQEGKQKKEAPKKKRKVSEEVESETPNDEFSAVDSGSEAEPAKPAKAAKKNAPTKQDDSSALSDAASETPVFTTTKADDGSDSEMSVLIDDEPAPKRRKSASGESKSGSKEKKPKKSAKESAPPDPDAEEVKKLQGQLGQCGIRKVWGKYLKPYETPKAKIKHLREMLVEAGMTGRFSQEKAKEIRDRRELEADLEAVTEGNKAWGKRRGKGPEEETRPREKRGLAKGFAELDFISDGEETD